VCSLPGFYVPEVVGREFCLGTPDCSVVINDTLAIERRGGRGGGGTLMLVRSVGRDRRPWNKGLLIGQKKPLEPKHVWSIRVRLEIARSWHDLVIFNLAIDSKLRACDLVKLRLDDICSGAMVRHRTTIVQKKTGRPVQFEITEQSRSSLEVWLPMLRTTGSRYLFPSRLHARPHIRRHELHRWTLHRLGDCLGIAEVILLPLRVRANILRRHQPSIVAQCPKFATEMMCANAGFHPDQARWHIGKAGLDLATRPFLTQHNRATLIVADNMERVLADIDADHDDCALQLLGHGVLLVFGAPSQHPIAGGAGARPDHPISGHQMAPILRPTDLNQ
jgi:hypothetical protein